MPYLSQRAILRITWKNDILTYINKETKQEKSLVKSCVDMLRTYGHFPCYLTNMVNVSAEELVGLNSCIKRTESCAVLLKSLSSSHFSLWVSG